MTPIFHPKTPYIVYADGSAIDNGKPHAVGGWAFVVLDKTGAELHRDSGGTKGTTNNRMELTGAIEAVKCFPLDACIEMRLDSQYVLKGASEWLPSWLKKGFKANEDLWREFIEAATGKRFVWTWVKGHSGDKWNGVVDEMAYAKSKLWKAM